MKKSSLSLILFSLLCSLNFALASSQSDKDFEGEHAHPQETYHRHLPRDTSYMRPNTDPSTKGEYDYVVGDAEFDRIHPIRRFKDREFSSSSCQIVTEEGGMGSGTVIKIQDTGSEEKRSELLTAKHVVLDESGKISFPKAYQGQTSFLNGTVNYLAAHEVDEICFNPHSGGDIALLKAQVTENHINDNLLESVAKVRNRQEAIKGSKVSAEEEVSMSHHPLGEYAQRRNSGWIRPNGDHTISSLPGSSGAGIFNLRGELGWIHSGGGQYYSPLRVLYDVLILKDLPPHKKTFNINPQNASTPIFREDLSKFCDCYKRKPSFSSKNEEGGV